MTTMLDRIQTRTRPGSMSFCTRPIAQSGRKIPKTPSDTEEEVYPNDEESPSLARVRVGENTYSAYSAYSVLLRARDLMHTQIFCNVFIVVNICSKTDYSYGSSRTASVHSVKSHNNLHHPPAPIPSESVPIRVRFGT